MPTLSQNVAMLDALAYKLPPMKRDFAVSLISQYGRKGSLSEKQIPHVEKLLREAQPREEGQDPRVANFYRIVEIFETAKAKGYKKKINLRFGDNSLKVKLSEAPSSGMNAGMIYVTANDEYKGKIDRKGNWQVQGETDSKLHEILNGFVMDPLLQAKKFGFETGVCCCCGRALTDPNSIAAGIGPICAEAFF